MNHKVNVIINAETYGYLVLELFGKKCLKNVFKIRQKLLEILI